MSLTFPLERCSRAAASLTEPTLPLKPDCSRSAAGVREWPGRTRLQIGTPPRVLEAPARMLGAPALIGDAGGLTWFEVFAVFAVSHLVGDFALQTEWQARHKRGGL